MKYKILIAAGLLLAGLQACTEEAPDAPKPAAPKVEFTIVEDAISVYVDSSVVFKASLVEGTGVKTAWFVDDVKVAGTPSVTWKFSQVGTSNVHFEAVNELGKVEKDYVVTVNGIPLVVEYSVPEDAAEAVVGTPFEVEVMVTGGDKSPVHAWTLDGSEAGSDAKFSYTFTEDEIGPHTLAYRGVNIDGMSASKTWALDVKDLPLEVSFTPADAEVSEMEGNEVKFSAAILHGATGAAWSWKVDGTEVATTSDYSYSCTAQGTFAIAVTVTNAIGESVSKSWTLTVTEKKALSLLFDDFENSPLGVSSYYKGNNVGGVSILQVVENPYKTSANSSSKVLVDKGSMMTNTSSGYFTFKVTTYPDATTQIPESERGKYTKFRLKIYLGTTGFTPLLQADITGNPRSAPSLINGVEFNPASPTLAAWNAAIKTNDWNEFVYDFSNSKYGSTMNNLANTGQLQFRVFVDFNNSGKAGQDVYFDDFEFLE